MLNRATALVAAVAAMQRALRAPQRPVRSRRSARWIAATDVPSAVAIMAGDHPADPRARRAADRMSARAAAARVPGDAAGSTSRRAADTGG